jgi:RNA polymerase sigma-70 factor (ECF subfamily)
VLRTELLLMIETTEAPSDRRSWAALAGQLRPFIARRVVTPADADDVLQEVLVRVHRGLPGLRDDDRVAAWVYRIARNAIVDHVRARTPVELDVEPTATTVPALEEDDDDAAQDLARALSFFVAALPSPYREAITLTELEGRTQREAAEMLGVSVSGMKSRVQRGRAKLRAMLEACCEIALDARGRVVSCVPKSGGEPPDGCCC